jgi:hypothetical protein
MRLSATLGRGPLKRLAVPVCEQTISHAKKYFELWGVEEGTNRLVVFTSSNGTTFVRKRETPQLLVSGRVVFINNYSLYSSKNTRVVACRVSSHSALGSKIVLLANERGAYRGKAAISPSVLLGECGLAFPHVLAIDKSNLTIRYTSYWGWHFLLPLTVWRWRHKQH